MLFSINLCQISDFDMFPIKNKLKMKHLVAAFFVLFFLIFLVKKLFYNIYGLWECLTFNLSAMYVTVSAQLLAGAFRLKQF